MSINPTFPSAFPEFGLGIGFGDYADHTRITGLGHNPDVDIASVPEDIWSGGGIYPWMTAATALEIVSSSANDTAAGTGTRTVMVNGLDINFVSISQVITLNGVTPVAIPSNLYRINAILQMSSGSAKINAGTITVRDSGAGATRGIMPIGYGTARQSIYTVPAGFTLQIISNYIAINGSGSTRSADISTYIQSPNGFYRMPITLTASDGKPYRHDGIPGIIIQEKTDYALRCTASTNDNAEISGAWLGILRKN